MKKVAYLGPDATTFGFMAAQRYFGKRAEYIPQRSHDKVCEAVGKGEVPFGVVAIANVLNGIVTESVLAVEHHSRRSQIKIVGEVELPIKLWYMRKKGTRKKKITKVLSHTAAINQCSRFLNELQKDDITVELKNSTGEAAEIASKKPGIGVIASDKAMELYDLEKVRETPVMDNPYNFTRFWIVSKGDVPKGKNGHKTCLLISLDQPKPGGLAKSLTFLANKGVNVLWPFPSPIPGRKYEYNFVIEVAGHIDDKGLSEAYEELRQSGLSPGGAVVLGSYPSTVNY